MFVIAAFLTLETLRMGYMAFELKLGNVSVLVEENIFKNRTWLAPFGTIFISTIFSILGYMRYLARVLSEGYLC
jgi:hypothetical protein